ncbi:MAG: hypothetical protein ACHREM_14475 [Polyangiales bacterium]
MTTRKLACACLIATLSVLGCDNKRTTGEPQVQAQDAPVATRDALAEGAATALRAAGAPSSAASTAAPLAMPVDAYTPVPTGFDFPGDKARLLKARDAGAAGEMRAHVWHLWAGLNQTARSGGPLWETWYPSDDVFATAPTSLLAAGARRGHRFQAPRQFAARGLSVLAEGQSLLSFVLFNEESRAHIRENKLYSRAELQRLNDSFGTSTPIADRSIKPFDRSSVALKVVWRAVKKSGLTAMPVWDAEPTRPDAKGNPPDTWKRAVAIDPNRDVVPAGESTDVTIGGRQLNARVVSLSQFYHVAISSDEELASARAALKDQTLQLGDFAVLVGMHVTTKEIDDWVWGTFWWHDRASDGRYAADRTPDVPGVFRNYLMEVSLSADVPKDDDGGAHVCFNPWLEARFVNGLHSNCLSCHQRAAFPASDFLPVTRGATQPGDPYFKGMTRVDFLWSINFEASGS